MKELSLHILDIVQNSLHAGAEEISICINENHSGNLYSIKFIDNGKGMSKETIDKILDPFFTTKNKKTGLGIPLLKQHAEMAGGELKIESEEGKGTILTVTFQHNHLDRQPMGNIAETVTMLIRANPEIRFIYEHSVNEKSFRFDTEEIKAELDGLLINSKEILDFIEEFIQDNLKELKADQNENKKK